MRRSLRQQIPSMFERRLLLLMLLCIGVGAILVGRTAQLTLGEEHRRLSREADRVLLQTTYIPTIRGSILDRHGRPLAVNRPGYDVAVAFTVLTGEWATDMGARQARREHSAIWSQLAPDRREAIISRMAEPYRLQVVELYRTLSELGGDLHGIELAELEKRRNAIIAEVQQTAAEVTLRNQQRRLEELDEPISWAEANTRVREQTQKHSLLRDVSEQVRSIVEGFIADAERHASDEQGDALAVWRQVEITRPKHRRYPYETIDAIPVDMTTMPPVLRSDTPVMVDVSGVALPIIGTMRDVFAEDMRDNPFYYQKDGDRITNLAGYRDGDRVGSTGVESSMETALRGARGKSDRRRDTGREDRIEPVAGGDVKLTIDIALQAKLQALLSEEVGLTVVQPYHKSKQAERGELGKPLNGAAVILQVDTGEVLAAASFPDYSLRQLEEDPDSVYKDPWRLPRMFRPVASRYQPGSTIKPIMLVSAVTAGRQALHEPIFCDGVLDPDHPNRFRCWYFKMFGMRHGFLDGAHAIQHSCNIYFYTVGQKMGVERTVDWYGRWGINRLTHCGLPEEVPGNLPPATDKGVNSAINMGIGQGEVSWTPVQAAAAYAALARGGVYVPPTFIAGAKRERTDLHVNASAVADAMEGLRLVVNEPEGTAYWLDRPAGERIINAEGVMVYGKSGTAAPGARLIDYNFNNRYDPQDGDKLISRDEVDDHAWFTVLVRPADEAGPMYAIAVVVEYAGSGSRVSGPIVNQIIHLLQREGWL